DGDAAGGGERLDALVELRAVAAEELARMLEQRLAFEIDMSVARGVVQRVQDPGLHALGRVRADADGPGDLVGGLEADAPHLEREAIGRARDDADGLGTELLEDARGERR